MEALKAADPRHGLFDSKMVALDPPLQVFGDIVERILREQRKEFSLSVHTPPTSF
jgi:hypothetical protein